MYVKRGTLIYPVLPTYNTSFILPIISKHFESVILAETFIPRMTFDCQLVSFYNTTFHLPCMCLTRHKRGL